MLLEAFADYATREAVAVIPEPARHHAKRAIVDWHAALFAGATHAPTAIMVRALADELDRGEARIFSGRRASIRAAALINATASHAAEVDDVFREAVYHPGSPTISAALAVGQARGCTGEQLLRAVIVGYEIATRIGALILKAHYRYWHTTGTVGCLGAAAAAGVVLGLGRREIMNALATAATSAAGLQQAFRSDSMSKPLHAGRAADVGVMSALGAAEGLVGAIDVIEGPAGFGAAMAGSPDWRGALIGLGTDYNITKITVKNHCCCGQAFAAIDAVLAVRADYDFDPADIERVDLVTYSTALEVAGSDRATTPAEARFSIPYVVAWALRYGSVRLGAFDDEALKNDAVRALMRRVYCLASADYDARFPGQRCAKATITLKDGRALSHEQTTRKGDPDAPLTDAELDAKYRELVIPVIGEASAQRLLDASWAVDCLDRVDELGHAPCIGTFARSSQEHA